MRHFLLLLFCASAISLKAQKPKLDSLYAIWQDENRADSTRVIAHRDYIYYSLNALKKDSAIALTNELIQFSAENDFRSGKSIGLGMLGLIFTQHGNYDKAIDNLEKALVEYEKLNNELGIAFSYYQLGGVYEKLGVNNKAVSYYNKSLNLYKKHKDEEQILLVLTQMGILFREQGDSPKALTYFNTTNKKAQKSTNARYLILSLANIGSVYEFQKDYITAIDYYEKALEKAHEVNNNYWIVLISERIGVAYHGMGELDKALKQYKQGLAHYKEFNIQNNTIITITRIGSIYHDKGEYDLALNSYNEAYALAQHIGNIMLEQDLYQYFGNTYRAKSEFDKAIDYCSKSLRIHKEQNNLRKKRDDCNCLFETYKDLGQGNQALVYLQMINAIDDSLKSEETTKKLQQIEFQKQVLKDSVETAEKERLVNEAHQAEINKKKQNQNIAIISGLFAFLLAIGFYTRWRYVHNSKAALQVEKDQSENLLLNILPAEIASELKEKGKADAREFELVSILFTDFKEFTQASELLSAKELVAEINTCFEAFDGICEKYNIEKIKTIGDSYMAAGGLPVPTEDSVKNTVLAALEMQVFIKARSLELEAQGSKSFKMRTGIHTGPIVAGIVGVKKFQYDIWGDTVNTASRMESHGEVDKVNISEATYELLKDDAEFAFESRGMIDAKGKGEMEMLFVSLKKEQI